MRLWRLIYSKPWSSFLNMAYDEALFIHYKKTNIPCLRIYSFNSLSFSLGYFQDPLKVLNYPECERNNIFFVRRPTGGGLIPHQTELTYSLICSFSDLGLDYSPRKDLFKRINLFIFKLFEKLGFKAYYPQNADLKKNSFLCLLNLQPFDILVEGKKIGGFAQRRRKDLILEQGIILLKTDLEEIAPFIKEKPQKIKESCVGLEELLKKKITIKELLPLIKESFQEAMDCRLKEDYFSKEEVNLSKILTKKYESRDWNFYRRLPSGLSEETFLA